MMLSKIRACLCAAVVAGGAAGAASAQTQTQTQAPAPESDYPAFRALSVPFRLTDFVVAEINYRLLTHPQADKAEQLRQYRWSFHVVQVIGERRDIMTDFVMHTAFTEFSHDDVTRLTALCARPAFRDLMAHNIDGLNQGHFPAFGSDMLKDGRFQAMPETDRDLIERFLNAVQNAEETKNPDGANIVAAVRARTFAEDTPAQVTMPIPVPPAATARNFEMAHYLDDAVWRHPRFGAGRDTLSDTQPGSVAAPREDEGLVGTVLSAYRLNDFLVAGVTAAAARDRVAYAGSPAQEAAVIATFVKAFHDNAATVTGAETWAVLGSFDHDELVRLTGLLAEPGAVRLQGRIIDAVRSGAVQTGDDIAALRTADPDFRAMTAADRMLIVRLADGIDYGLASTDSMVWLVRTGRVVEARLAGRPDPVFDEFIPPPWPVPPAMMRFSNPYPTALPLPPGPVPPVLDAAPLPPDPPLAYDPARYVRQVHWYLPQDPAKAARVFPQKAAAKKLEGDVVLDCGVNAQGRLSDCETVRETPAGYGFGASAEAFMLQTVQADAATVKAGIAADARARFVIHWWPDGTMQVQE